MKRKLREETERAMPGDYDVDGKKDAKGPRRRRLSREKDRRRRGSWEEGEGGRKV